MNRLYKKLKIINIISVFFLFCSSASVFLLPFTSMEELSNDTKDILSPSVIGGIFWIGILIGYLLLLYENTQRKKELKKNGKVKRAIPGAFQIFRNKKAMMIDCIFIISLLGLIICQSVTIIKPNLGYTMIFLVLFSFHLHCYINGENYKYMEMLRTGIDKNGTN